MSIKCKAYHGTDAHSKNSIIKEQCFKESSSDNEWAGRGVYFFVDENEELAHKHAYDWAKNLKKISLYNIGIVFAELEYNIEDIFNLCEEADIEIFNEYRRCCFEKATEAAKERGKTLPERYNNKSMFDCFVINGICDKSNYKIVKKRVYIAALEDKYNGFRIPISFTPNCTIAAIRDKSIIRKIGDCDGRKTSSAIEISN